MTSIVRTPESSGSHLYTARMVHREEATWTIRVEASAEFDEAYDGDLDGYAWRDQQFRELQQRATAAVLRALAGTPGWRVRTGNRGLAATDEILVHVELDLDAELPR
jgi:hypothetical protein